MPPSELSSQYYDSMFEGGGKEHAYHKGPHDSFMFVLWDAIAKKLTSNDCVAEFGCGAGQLANLIMEYGYTYIYGVDLSFKGIQYARILNQWCMTKFHIGSMYDEKMFNLGEYNTAIFCECLEHINDDLLPLSYLKPGTRVILSVPTAESKEHVRCFPTSLSIKEHYGAIVDINSIDTILIPINNPGNKHYWYIVDGVIK